MPESEQTETDPVHFMLNNVEAVREAMFGSEPISPDQRIALFQCVLLFAIYSRLPESGPPT